MLPRNDVRRFRKQLLSWFRQFQRDLPWRRTKDPYRVWLSEIMLQQTRVAAVIPYYQRFLERFPDVNALAAAPQEEVLRLWSGLGYYSRARNLQHAAQQIVAKYGGVFPRGEEDALELPGIGSYTAAAILSIAYGAKHAVLDGNVARVLARIFVVRGDLRDAKRWQGLQKQANALLDPKSPGDWNQAMMELGATLCTPRSPQCLLCPVAQFCRARKLGIAESLPAKRKKRATEQITLASAVLVDPLGHTLLLPPLAGQTRPSHNEVSGLASKMWHFPTVAVQRNADEELLGFLRELSRNLTKTRKLALQPVATVRHTVTYRAITIHVFHAQVDPLPHISDAKAVSLAELSEHASLAISNLTRKIARAALANTAAGATVRPETLSFAQPGSPGIRP
jgi:A/G-specific adenine glycosylase